MIEEVSSSTLSDYCASSYTRRESGYLMLWIAAIKLRQTIS